MRAKNTKQAKLNFDDRDLTVNRLSVERSEQIDKVAAPILEEMLERLRQEKPHLFQVSKK